MMLGKEDFPASTLIKQAWTEAPSKGGQQVRRSRNGTLALDLAELQLFHYYDSDMAHKDEKAHKKNPTIIWNQTQASWANSRTQTLDFILLCP